MKSRGRDDLTEWPRRGRQQGRVFKLGEVSRLEMLQWCEPVWPSGKALGWKAEGLRFESASALISLQKGCGLWTLSCDFVDHFLLKH